MGAITNNISQQMDIDSDSESEVLSTVSEGPPSSVAYTNERSMITASSGTSYELDPSTRHQENMRVVFGHLWGLWKDLKTSKTWRPHIFRETGTFSFRDMMIFERPLRIFQRWTWSFAKTIFGITKYLYESFDHAYQTADALNLIIFKGYITDG